MELTLAENIRSFRKQRRLTQEQLAEVLGVTTGAVYKWESGLSIPDLSLIVKMADFFDTSVDVLLGYKMKDNRLESIGERLSALLRNADPEAITEAEKALKKYPNSFKIVHMCADIYLIFGTQTHNKDHLYRALELFEQALILLPQNTDLNINEQVIYGEMGDAYVSLEEYEKGLELMKKYNANGLFNDEIGVVLAFYLHRPEEAEPFLSDALLVNLASLINVISGYAFIYGAKRDFVREKEVVLWGQNILLGLQSGETPNFLDKAHSFLLIMLTHAQIHIGETADAQASLEKAWEHVLHFDSAPDYGIGSFRFVSIPEGATVYDGLGMTARDSADELIRLLNDPTLDKLWKDVCENA